MLVNFFHQNMKNTFAKRYANALFQNALELDEIKSVSENLHALLEALDLNHQYKGFIINAMVPKKVKQVFLNTIKANIKLPKIVENFLQILVTNNRMYAIYDIVTAYEKIVKEHNNEQDVEITTAFNLKANAKKELKTALSTKLNKKVNVLHHVDPNIMGGIVMQIGWSVFDNSVKHHLSKIRAKLCGPRF
jgi:F-type H+-transporting ATPase subunit delta